jgi:hypothetical protein
VQPASKYTLHSRFTQHYIGRNGADLWQRSLKRAPVFSFRTDSIAIGNRSSCVGVSGNEIQHHLVEQVFTGPHSSSESVPGDAHLFPVMMDVECTRGSVSVIVASCPFTCRPAQAAAASDAAYSVTLRYADSNARDCPPQSQREGI